MISIVQNIVQAGGVGQSGHGALVMDLSFKLNASDFGLAGMAVPSKHLHNGVWRTDSILLSCGLRVLLRCSPNIFHLFSLFAFCYSGHFVWFCAC